MLFLKAALLGIVEGVTEFLPISSTGHLIVASALLDYPEQSRPTFEIFIQLGAILAVIWNYRQHLSHLLRRAPAEAEARAFLGKLLLAFLPAALAGFLFHHAIEEHLFSPRVVGLTLLVGGVVLVGIERRRWDFRVHELERTGWKQAVWVGLAQVLSLVPGVSRAGATIVGGMFAGMDRATATRFSFYLSIPTLCAASLYSLIKARHQLAWDHTLGLGMGLALSFLSALLVVRGFIAFVQRRDLRAFGYYRIAAGAAILLLARVGLFR